ncbi:DNA cytosine methyltransferase [Gaopeijia maritima]|uniref:DNA cytosine methyltransferase n=1 Tax=Gaopeijia maritima TaxID=3119007 RepID=UPI00328D41F9
MSLFPQLLLDIHDELLVDLFAGGGGASVGIEMATGRQVDVAINHDADAVAMHEANHPQTRHMQADVFEVDPREATEGRPVGLLWASPDCTFFSKARGGKPLRNRQKKRRALAWVVTRWAGQVRPRVIMLENVEEFTDWCPLVARRDRKTGRVVRADGTVARPGERVALEDQQLVPCGRRPGHRFRAWVRSLEAHGYRVEWRELRACDYGAPTIRKRLFLIARCDDQPIVWPEPSHGPAKGLRPYRTAAECIDWSEPMCSIFATRDEARAWARHHKRGTPVRPLAENTMRRIARGVMKYVVEAAEPFVVAIQNYGRQDQGQALGTPLRTITASPKGGGFALVAPTLAQTGYGEREGQAPRSLDIREPLGTIVGGGQKHALVSAFLARHWGGMVGRDLREPHPTTTTRGTQDQIAAVSLAKLRGTSHDADASEPLHTVSAGGNHHGLVAAHIQRDFGSSVGHDAGDPLGTITAGGGGKARVVYSFIQKYYGQGVGTVVDEPAPTVTTKDRMGVVTVEVGGEPFVIVDIAMRMLQPRELYRAQGFPTGYVIDQGVDGKRLTKTAQVRMVGNSVAPPQAAALVGANLPELVARDEARERVA